MTLFCGRIPTRSNRIARLLSTSPINSIRIVNPVGVGFLNTLRSFVFLYMDLFGKEKGAVLPTPIILLESSEFMIISFFFLIFFQCGICLRLKFFPFLSLVLNSKFFCRNFENNLFERFWSFECCSPPRG